jgi:predicted metal-dependent HD superfamily phosphohydrolase
MNALRDQFIRSRDVSGDLEKTFELLQNLYSEKHRFYHNLEHIKFLLALFEEFRGNIEDETAVFFSIWFHDAIYDPRRNDNEKQSAKLAAAHLGKLSLPESRIEKIEKIILATEKHSAEGLDADGKLFLDFDLAILGASRADYKKYAGAVRQEYGFVSDEDYRTGRRRVLQNFLRRDFIYLTNAMRQRFEKNARRNLGEELERL